MNVQATMVLLNTSLKVVWIMMMMALPTVSMLVPLMQVVQFTTDMGVLIMTKMVGQTMTELGFTAIAINKIGNKSKTVMVME